MASYNSYLAGPHRWSEARCSVLGKFTNIQGTTLQLASIDRSLRETGFCRSRFSVLLFTLISGTKNSQDLYLICLVWRLDQMCQLTLHNAGLMRSSRTEIRKNEVCGQLRT